MLAETDYESMVMAKGKRFLEGLKELQNKHKEIGDVDGLGLALRAEICEADRFHAEQETARQNVRHRARWRSWNTTARKPDSCSTSAVTTRT